MKAGINAKVFDKVKDPQCWPHAHLQYKVVNKQVKFDELNFQLFWQAKFPFSLRMICQNQKGKVG